MDESFNQFRENLIPQPSVDSQKISQSLLEMEIDHQNHTSMNFTPVNLVSLDSRTRN